LRAPAELLICDLDLLQRIINLAAAVHHPVRVRNGGSRARSRIPMSLQSDIIPSGRGRARNPAGRAVIATTAMLLMFVLLGLDLSLVALIALCVLGSILIMTDSSIKHEPIAMLV
jgi:hypothetical protein